MKNLALVLTAVFACTLSLAQEAAAPAAAPAAKFSWAEVLGIIGSIYFMCWGIGEGLTRLSNGLRNKYPNIGKIGQVFIKASFVIGSFLGRFGYSVPKAVISAEAEKINK